MPLQGVFNADFTAFTNACAAAETSLKGFETGASKTESALNKMADSISGTKIVQQAMLATKAVEDVGGAATLTEKELSRMSDMAAQGAEKLQRMGQTVPPQMQALADATKATSDNTSTWNSVLTTLEGTFGALTLQRVIDQLIELGKAVFDDADKLTNLQDRTAIGVETLQRLRIVGDDAGVSLDTMANAANKLQKNLGQGNESTAGALAQLGIQFADLKKMSPEDQFYAVADALKKVDDQDTQVALGVQLMGKNFTELLPAIKEGFDKVKDSSAGMSAGTIKILDDLGDAAKRTYQNVKDYLGERLADTLTGTTEELRRLAGEFANLEKLAQPAAEKMANFWGQILPPSVPKDLQEITDKSDALAKESKAVAEAMVELDSAGKGWQGTLNTINGDVVEAVKWYLEAGVSQKALATAFGLTDVQVKAVDSAMKNYTETLKAVQKIEGDHAKQAETNYLGLSKAENDYTQKRLENAGKAADQLMAIDQRLTDEYNKQTMSRSDYESQKLWAAAEAQIAAFQKTGATAEQVTQFSNKVYEETALKASEIDYTAGQTIQDITSKAVEGVKTMAAAGAAALETLQGGEKLPGSKTETAFGQNYLLSPTGARVPLGPHGEIPKNFDDLYSGKSSFPQFARGVENFSGGLAIVGEKGPELVNLPAGSDVFPSGVGGTNVTNHIYVNGTAADVARQVAAEIMKSLKSTQQLTLR